MISVIHHEVSDRARPTHLLLNVNTPKINIASKGATLGKWSVRNLAITANATVTIPSTTGFSFEISDTLNMKKNF